MNNISNIDINISNNKMNKEDLKARTSFLLVLAPPPALRNRNGSAREPLHLEAKTYFTIFKTKYFYLVNHML